MLSIMELGILDHELGLSENQGPQFGTQKSRALVVIIVVIVIIVIIIIIGTPTNRTLNM